MAIEFDLSTRIVSQALNRYHRTFAKLGMKHLQTSTYPCVGTIGLWCKALRHGCWRCTIQPCPRTVALAKM